MVVSEAPTSQFQSTDRHHQSVFISQYTLNAFDHHNQSESTRYTQSLKHCFVHPHVQLPLIVHKLSVVAFIL
ncbi:MAG: hypothetical protein ACOZBL_06150 [Patescibacteria group bacterium]